MNASKYKACVYVRLSKEDGDLDGNKAESNSISNQKSLILNFLKDKEDIEVVSIREDDGYTGSNFDRPAFQMMMDDIKDGKVNCIVVKDLSRFGREYIDSGRYIERLFPALGVRFIAINDGYDSQDENNIANEIVIPFKNLMNDSYCRDISIKIRSHLEVKRQNGEFVGNFSPYGYKKDESNHNRLVPDEYAGHVVQDIFAWIKQGMSVDAISKKLNSLGILSPMDYRTNNGEHLKTVFKKHSTCLWTGTAVRRIAENVVYTGTLVQGKVTTPNHKIKRIVNKPEEKWAVVEKNHESLVSMHDFETVQRLLSVDMRTSPDKESVYMLSGIAICADCGSPMTRHSSVVSGHKYIYYVCSRNKRRKQCSPHRIREEVLVDKVKSSLQDMVTEVIEADEVIKKLGDRDNHRIDLKKMKERMVENEKLVTKYNEMLISLYEDLKCGVVELEDYRMIKKSFELKRSSAEEAARLLENGFKEAVDKGNLDNSWVLEFKKYRNFETLTRNVVIDLVRNVKIYEGGNIEVILNSNDQYLDYLYRSGKDMKIEKEGVGYGS